MSLANVDHLLQHRGVHPSPLHNFCFLFGISIDDCALAVALD